MNNKWYSEWEVNEWINKNSLESQRKNDINEGIDLRNVKGEEKEKLKVIGNEYHAFYYCFYQSFCEKTLIIIKFRFCVLPLHYQLTSRHWMKWNGNHGINSMLRFLEWILFLLSHTAQEVIAMMKWSEMNWN